MATSQERFIETYAGMRVKGHAISVVTPSGEAWDHTAHDLAQEIVGGRIEEVRAQCSRRGLGSCAIQPHQGTIGKHAARANRVDTYSAGCDRDCPMGLPVVAVDIPVRVTPGNS